MVLPSDGIWTQGDIRSIMGIAPKTFTLRLRAGTGPNGLRVNKRVVIFPPPQFFDWVVAELCKPRPKTKWLARLKDEWNANRV